MKLDKSIIPESLEKYLDADGYDPGIIPTDISATRLKDSPRVHRLTSQYRDQISVERQSRGFAKLGEAWHNHMEMHAPDEWIVERRFYAQVDGRIVSGAIDAIEPAVRGVKVWDYKVMTAYKAQTDLKDFEKQLNIYAFLLRQNGMNPVGLYISGVIRDWSDRKVSGSYPDTMFPTFELPIWSEEEAESYIRERLSLHFGEELPPCTDEERWMSSTKYAVVSSKTGKTLRLYNDEQSALDHKTKSPFHVEKRKPEPIRCQRFCDVAQFCTQYQSELFAEGLLSDGQQNI